MRRHNKLNYDNKIALIEERMKDHQYSDNLKAERLGLEMDPEYIMMDACDACYNAAVDVFPDAKILMCWFHVQKNIKANLEKILSKDQFLQLQEHMRELHMSKSEKEYEKKISRFKTHWKNENRVVEYVESWLRGRFSNWQIFNNPTGWASTNSNIESFNATIKRDFTFRKRYSVFMSINVIVDMIVYYSTHTQIFNTTARFNKKVHLLAKELASGKYTKLDKYTVVHADKYHINLKTKSCNCRYFLKHAVCSHILGYMYKKYENATWFDEKYTIRETTYVLKIKIKI
jgi:hypothetical protein